MAAHAGGRVLNLAPGSPRTALRRLALMLLLGCSVSVVHAVDELALKAAIVYNVLQFVDWPREAAPAAGDALALCVDPASALAAPLRSLQGRPVRQHRLDVRDVAPGDGQARRCHALYQDASSRGTAALRRQLDGAPVLVISDETTIDDRVVVQLALQHGRIVFDIDLRSARRNGLQFSSKLLRLAREVKE